MSCDRLAQGARAAGGGAGCWLPEAGVRPSRRSFAYGQGDRPFLRDLISSISSR